jgi:hypothetical protein
VYLSIAIVFRALKSVVHDISLIQSVLDVYDIGGKLCEVCESTYG